MSKKFIVETSGGEIDYPHDEANGVTPVNAIPITEAEYHDMINSDYLVKDYEYIGGKIRVKPDIKATKYKRDREKEFPSIEGQLDMIYKDKINNTSLWVNEITRIKVKYPKP